MVIPEHRGGPAPPGEPLQARGPARGQPGHPILSNAATPLLTLHRKSDYKQ